MKSGKNPPCLVLTLTLTFYKTRSNHNHNHNPKLAVQQEELKPTGEKLVTQGTFILEKGLIFKSAPHECKEKSLFETSDDWQLQFDVCVT